VIFHLAVLVACAAAIYLSCDWFVNAVEWLGLRLKVGNTAVGTILAAIGTALPESVVTLVAVVFGGDSQAKEIGVGAAMGGPLVVGTIAYGVVGWTLAARRQLPASVEWGDRRQLVRSQEWFLAIFVVKVTLGLVTFAIKPWLGLLFFAAYGLYFVRELRHGGEQADITELRPLRLQRRRPVPATWAVVAQTLVSLVIVFAASQLFVHQLEAVGPELGLSASVTALLLSPIATELPEVMNAIIWVRQGKTQLALANLSGAMMIQATVPSGLGILFTPWRFDTALLVSGLITMAAVGYLLIILRTGRLTVTRLSLTGAFYLAFALMLVPILHGA
jgi:cation:H+ antiporter